MTEASALAHIAHHALNNVFNTVGLEPKVASRVSRRVELHIHACVYPSAEAGDFAAWAEEMMAALLSTEDIRPHCPFVNFGMVCTEGFLLVERQF